MRACSRDSLSFSGLERKPSIPTQTFKLSAASNGTASPALDSSQITFEPRRSSEVTGGANPALTNDIRTSNDAVAQANRSHSPTPELKPIAHRIVELIEARATRPTQELQIELTPKDLGKLDIKLSVNNERLSVTIHAGSSITRDWLLVVSDRLRDSISQESNFDVSVDVSQQNSDSNARQSKSQTLETPQYESSRSSDRGIPTQSDLIAKA